MITARPICPRCIYRLGASQLSASATAGPHPHLIASYSTSSTAALNPTTKPRKTFKPKDARLRVRGSPKPSPQDLQNAVALFNDVVNPSPQSAEAKAVAELEVISKLKVMVEGERRYGPRERLNAFKSEVIPYFQALRGPTPPAVFESSSRYLANIVDQVAREGLLGFSVELSETLAHMGNWKLVTRSTLVLNLCYILVSSVGSKTKQSSPEALVELIDMWKHLSQLGRASQVGQPLTWTLPTTEELQGRLYEGMLERLHDEVDPEAMDARTLSNLQPTQALALPFFPGSKGPATRLVSGLVASVVIFWDRRIVGARIPQEAEPLLKAVATVLHQTSVSPKAASNLLSQPFTRLPGLKLNRLNKYVKGQWMQAADSLLSPETTWGDTIMPTHSRSGVSYLSEVHKELRKAHKVRDFKKMEKAWRAFTAKLKAEPELMDLLRDEADFMDFWIFAWCSVRHNANLQATVDLMHTAGLEPTVKSYTAMMHGWKTAKDIDKIDALWDTLMQSEIQMDSYIWAERVSAYIECGQPQRAIEALGQMMSLWKTSAARQEQDTAVKPTIEVINATLKQLLLLDKKAAHDVLAWASKENIQPNVFTYNILIREALRSDSRDSVPGLLSTMREQGVSVDAATFTIILEEVLKGMHSSSSHQQVQAIQQILADMAAAGVKPSNETYGKMLHAVASLPNGGSDEAIGFIQDHARRTSHQITPHMVTILVERIIRRESPDMNAIRALLDEHGMHRVTQGDQTLWERVITGYAITGNLVSAMQVYHDMRNNGRPVKSLICLRDLLEALLQGDERASAKKVVQQSLEDKMAGQDDLNGGERYWRHHFWYLAHNTGLLKELKLPPLLSKTLGQV